jgi:hypothetical protein
LNGKQPKSLELKEILKPFPSSWAEQRRRFGFPRDRTIETAQIVPRRFKRFSDCHGHHDEYADVGPS